MKRLALVVVACGAPTTPPQHEVSRPTVTFDPAASLTIASEDVAFGAVPGTIVHPTPPGKWPGIVLMAGSGPTDRDWNSPLLAGKNGSGKLLAEALAHHGAVVLRFDKLGTGANKTPIASATFDTYRDEGRAALGVLRARHDVDAARLFVVGHSEGGIHATRVVLAEGNRIAGLVLLSSIARTEKDVMLGQLEAQLRRAMPLQADAVVASLRRAFDDYVAGKAVDPTTVTTIPKLQQLVASVVSPKTVAIGRGLFAFAPLPAVAQVTVPVFVYNGMKDVQVDPQLDAAPLAHAAKHATLFLAPDANHVLEHEPRSLDELRANPAAVNSNADDRVLDDASVAALVGWLATISRP